MVDTRRRKFQPDGTIEKSPPALVPITQATDHMPHAQLFPMTKAQLERLAAANKANPQFDVDSPHFVGFDELGRIAQYSNAEASADQYGVGSSGFGTSGFGTSTSGMGSMGMGFSELGQSTTPRQFSTSPSASNNSDRHGQFTVGPSDIGQSMNSPRRFSKSPSSTGNFDVQQPNNGMPSDMDQLPPMNMQFGQLPFPPALCFNMANVLSDGPAEFATNDEGDELLATIFAETAERHSQIMTNTTSDLGGLLQTHFQAGPAKDPELERRMKLVKEIEESLKAAKPVVSEGSVGSRIDEDKLSCRTSFCGNFVLEEEYIVGARYCQECEASTNSVDSLFQSIHEEKERDGYENEVEEAAWTRAAAIPRQMNPLRELAMEEEK